MKKFLATLVFVFVLTTPAFAEEINREEVAETVDVIIEHYLMLEGLCFDEALEIAGLTRDDFTTIVMYSMMNSPIDRRHFISRYREYWVPNLVYFFLLNFQDLIWFSGDTTTANFLHLRMNIATLSPILGIANTIQVLEYFDSYTWAFYADDVEVMYAAVADTRFVDGIKYLTAEHGVDGFMKLLGDDTTYVFRHLFDYDNVFYAPIAHRQPAALAQKTEQILSFMPEQEAAMLLAEGEDFVTAMMKLIVTDMDLFYGLIEELETIAALGENTFDEYLAIAQIAV